TAWESTQVHSAPGSSKALREIGAGTGWPNPRSLPSCVRPRPIRTSTRAPSASMATLKTGMRASPRGKTSSVVPRPGVNFLGHELIGAEALLAVWDGVWVGVPNAEQLIALDQGIMPRLALFQESREFSPDEF